MRAARESRGIDQDLKKWKYPTEIRALPIAAPIGGPAGCAPIGHLLGTRTSAFTRLGPMRPERRARRERPPYAAIGRSSAVRSSWITTRWLAGTFCHPGSSLSGSEQISTAP